MLKNWTTLTVTSLILATASYADDLGVITPQVDQMASPVQRTIEPSHWHSYAAATISADFEQFQAIADHANETRQDVLVTGIPLGADLDIDAFLHEVNPIHENSMFVVMEEQPDGTIAEVQLPAPNLVVLAGHVDGDPSSRVLLAEGDMGTMGYVRLGQRTFIISSGPQATDQATLSFDPALLPKGALSLLPLACELLDIPGEDPFGESDEAQGGLAGGGLPCRKVGFAIETDNEFLSNLFNNNQSAANAYASLLLAATTEIYVEQFNTYLEIDYIRLWTATDPWSASGTSSELTNFRDYWEQNMTSVDRDLAHFLSGRGLGGGVAWLGGLCGGSYAYALSANLDGSFPYPILDNSNQNWDLMVFAHETGHSFGSGHTHDYNPPIDGCANGDCSVADANEATIMGYCHLCSGGLSNVRMEFHPRVEDLILDYLDSISCNYTGNGEGAIAVDDSYSLDFNQIGILNILGNDAEVSCGAISIIDFDSTSTQGGTVELLAGSGTTLDRVRYTPTEDFAGSDSFSYTIADEIGNQSVGTVSIAVATTVYFTVVGGNPESIYAEGQELEVLAFGAGITLNTSSFLASVNDGTGWQQSSFASIGSDRYTGTLPDLVCPGSAQIQFSIESSTGATFTSDIITTSIGFELDNFETGNPLWLVSGEPDSTGNGIWERGTPDGDSDRGDPATDFDGSGTCWLTGAGTGNTDVDDGSTYLTSVRFAGDENTIVTWAQWYDNTAGAAPGADVFTIEISNDFGDTWVFVDQAGPSGSDSVGGWIVQEIRVADFVEPTTQLKMRWTASDLGEGSVVEAAIDAYGTGECVVPDDGILGDLNNDGFVDGQDLAILLGDWGGPGLGDLDGDNTINGSDLAILLGAWFSG